MGFVGEGRYIKLPTTFMVGPGAGDGRSHSFQRGQLCFKVLLNFILNLLDVFVSQNLKI